VRVFLSSSPLFMGINMKLLFWRKTKCYEIVKVCNDCVVIKEFV